MDNVKRLNDLTEREQKEFIFKLMTIARKDDTFFMTIYGAVKEREKIINNSGYVRIIT